MHQQVKTNDVYVLYYYNKNFNQNLMNYQNSCINMYQDSNNKYLLHYQSKLVKHMYIFIKLKNHYKILTHMKMYYLHFISKYMNQKINHIIILLLMNYNHLLHHMIPQYHQIMVYKYKNHLYQQNYNIKMVIMLKLHLHLYKLQIMHMVSSLINQYNQYHQIQYKIQMMNNILIRF